MKIVAFEFEEWQRDYFQFLEDSHDVIFEPLPLSLENISDYRMADIITTFIKSNLSEKILKKFKNLKLIATQSTGFDHIDLGYCRRNNITVCNVPAYGDNTIAEYVFALLLSLSRKIPETLQRTKSKNFSREGLQGFDLLGKTIGVIGTGNIGKHVIKIAKGFGMNVLANDLYPDTIFTKEMGFLYVSLEELLKQSDIISLHVPANYNTENMIDQKEFSLIKEGAILINTSRGSIINHEEMLKAVKQGKVSAAALDVLPNEAQFFMHGTDIINNTLLEMDNVFITPHNAYNTKEAVTRIMEITVSNIQSFLDGKINSVSFLAPKT